MLAEMTLSKGRDSSGGVGGWPFFNLALYDSARVASSPRTAYWASRTWELILLMLRLRRELEVDMVR